jgi:hypothetical protein
LRARQLAEGSIDMQVIEDVSPQTLAIGAEVMSARGRRLASRDVIVLAFALTACGGGSKAVSKSAPLPTLKRRSHRAQRRDRVPPPRDLRGPMAPPSTGAASASGAFDFCRLVAPAEAQPLSENR